MGVEEQGYPTGMNEKGEYIDTTGLKPKEPFAGEVPEYNPTDLLGNVTPAEREDAKTQRRWDEYAAKVDAGKEEQKRPN